MSFSIGDVAETSNPSTQKMQKKDYDFCNPGVHEVVINVNKAKVKRGATWPCVSNGSCLLSAHHGPSPISFVYSCRNRLILLVVSGEAISESSPYWEDARYYHQQDFLQASLGGALGAGCDQWMAVTSNRPTPVGQTNYISIRSIWAWRVRPVWVIAIVGSLGPLSA